MEICDELNVPQFHVSVDKPTDPMWFYGSQYATLLWW